MKFSRGVDAYKDGELFMSFPTTAEAVMWLRGHGWPKAVRQNVCGAATGIQRTAYGFTWKSTGPAKRPYGSAKGDDRRLYNIWADMKSRVTDPANDSYKYEGARGVSVCDEWQGYDGFRAWAESHGYADGLVIERRDLSGDYCPENCSWGNPLLGRGHALTHQRKPVIRRDGEGRVTRYGSETEAAIALIGEGRGNPRGDVTMTISNIYNNLSRRSMTAYGSVWWYEGDEDAPRSDAE